MYHHKAAVRFQCSGCGQCCLGHPDEHMIELASGEGEAIRQFLGIGKRLFRQDYLVRLGHNSSGIRIDDQGRCVLLDDQRRCTVYPVRPRQCRTYPFWPELLDSAASWHAERRRCEGIDRGDTISLAMIEQQLRLLDD